jgi:hypothetical protein
MGRSVVYVEVPSESQEPMEEAFALGMASIFIEEIL